MQECADHQIAGLTSLLNAGISRRDLLKIGLAAAIALAVENPVRSIAEFSPRQATTTSDVDSKGYVIGAHLYAPYTNNPQDASTGILKFEEWKDAGITRLIGGPGTLGYLLLQHDDKGLYVGVSIPTQKYMTTEDSVGFAIDTKHVGYGAGPNDLYVPNDYRKTIIGEVRYFKGNIGLTATRSNSGTPVNNVVMEASINQSPNIGYDSGAHHYRMTGYYSTDSNLMWTCFVPFEILRAAPDTDVLDTIGFRIDMRVSGSPYNPSFLYPIFKSKTTDAWLPLADLTFLPETITTTVSLATTRTKSLTSTKLVTIVRTREVGPPMTFWAAIVGIIALSLGAVAYLLLRIRKLRQSQKPQS